MTKEQIAISSLAMDLKRVALGYHSGSERMAKRFSEEALKRKDEITNVPPYLKNILESLPQTFSKKDKEKLAEDALMYSTLFQNYALKKP